MTSKVTVTLSVSITMAELMNEATLERLSQMIMDSEGIIFEKGGADAQDEINALWEVYELAYDKVHQMGVFANG